MRFGSKHALVGVALFALCATAAQGDVTASVVRQLSQQGYEVQSVQRTLLGRMRVISTQGDLRRETVFDPRSGTIMRDIARRGDAGGLAGLLGSVGQRDENDDDDRSSGSRSSSSGFGGSDTDDDNVSDDDNDDSDDGDDSDDDSDDDSGDDGDDGDDDSGGDDGGDDED